MRETKENYAMLCCKKQHRSVTENIKVIFQKRWGTGDSQEDKWKKRKEGGKDGSEKGGRDSQGGRQA